MDCENDNPIQDESQDVLGRSERAKELAEYIRTKFIKTNKNPKDRLLKSYNIGLVGAWGEGKTSFINLLKKQFEEPENKNWFRQRLNKIVNYLKTSKSIEIKEFNPWYFPDKCDIHEQFLSFIDNRRNDLMWWLGYYVILVILSSIGAFDYYFKQWFNNEAIQLVLNFISKAIENLKATYLLPMAIILWYSQMRPYYTKSLISKIKSLFLLNSVSDLINLSKEDKFDYLKVEKELKKLTHGRKLLVIIDNIDRLYPFQIKRIFDLVKGVGDLPNIIYILAFDRQVVSKALNKKGVEEGSKYLDKFIQYSISLHTNYKEHVIRAMTEAFPNQKEVGYYAERLSLCIANIRELKILINIFKQNYKSLQDNVIFGQLLLVTAIGVQNHEIYYLISKSKKILCSKESNEKSFEKLKRLKEEINLLKPSSALWSIISDLFPITKDGLTPKFDMFNAKNKDIDHPDYFDIYFEISFPDDLVSEEDFKSLNAVAIDKKKLTKRLLELLKPDTEEKRQEIPNRIVNPFKWLDNLATKFLDSSNRILEFSKYDNISNWLFSLAMVTEKYANDVEDAQNKWYIVPRFHDFLDKFAQLLQQENPAKDNGSPLIYAFLRVYLKETNPSEGERYISRDRIPELREIIINNIKMYSKNNNISQLSFFATIIHFASSDFQEHKEVVEIIKETIKQNNALLKLVGLFLLKQRQTEKYVIDGYLEHYILFEEAIQRLESGKPYEDTDFYIEALSESIINKK